MIVVRRGRVTALPDWALPAALLCLIGFAFMVLLIGLTALHEYGHILIDRAQGASISEVCVLGWNSDGLNGWVRPNQTVDMRPHYGYDVAVGGDREYYSRLYGVEDG